jgi:diguanylate cyclase (GGDEF)-like protein
LAVRWGGEEFLLVLKACDRNEALRIAENLRESIGALPLDIQGKTLNLSISIGVSEFNGSESPEQTVDRADSALYKAKNAGRNRVESA